METRIAVFGAAGRMGHSRPKSAASEPLAPAPAGQSSEPTRRPAALAALLIASLAMLAMPVALRYLIDNGFIAQDAGTVNRYFLWFLAATVYHRGRLLLRDIRDIARERSGRTDPASPARSGPG